ncbi:hypothetical protein CRG98_043040 [Punica granatum]|uniref:Uncharacterized protein n=1 Tax=Punica granatum TaxID=22663 RepID=A0A2I0HXZ5_PUNGR|nr:hypothetical protein CRG98_043040 [Punica granatum]
MGRVGRTEPDAGWGSCWRAGPLLDWAVRCWTRPALLDQAASWAVGRLAWRGETVWRPSCGRRGADGRRSSRGKASEFRAGGCPDELRGESVWELRVAGELGVRESCGRGERSGAGSVWTGMSSESEK